MFDGLMLADHTLAPGATPLKLRTCENCRRPFLSNKPTSLIFAFCNPCRKMYQELEAQLWGCVECGTERKFGDYGPEKTRGNFLRCGFCARTTEHAFSRMTHVRTGY
jgi:hypothetical protein